MLFDTKTHFGLAVVKQEGATISGRRPVPYLTITDEEFALKGRFAKQRSEIEDKRNAFVDSAANLYDKTVGNTAFKAIQEDCKRLTGHKAYCHKDATGTAITFYCILCHADLG